ncbi:MAG: 2-amino-4-hydroxy-6-hydroxymethyldihydropteridine diphosphokinase [Phycisphaeraceae bacterium]|nr:2-amino-4-hydroxy-6-hydroxymethyldihydropteridine diphosphokinase [Phycisphaeraceae bacterium]
MPSAYIGIGSNLGDRREHLAAAREALADLPRTLLSGFSPVYETEPVGPGTQRPYLNAVASVQTGLDPQTLLEKLMEIEMDAGRRREQRWGPRTLDLDLLLYDDRVVKTDRLTLPHPRMHERWFVLKPLADLAEDLVHPVLNITVERLLADLAEPESSGRSVG